ncbi:MAG: AMP-binding protein, partial [Candidatus Promineifilaceae bacterium]|nr:AMP-binding protein [Candidatus Promineifilaceae bacterium]
MVHSDWTRRHAERTPDKLAMVDLHSRRQLNYRQFNQRANRFASFLRDELGIEQGDRISILAKNSSDYFEVLFACSKIGAILNTLNWRLTVPELEYIISDCAPRMLIYEPEFEESVDGLRSLVEFEAYVVMGTKAPEAEWTYEDALEAGDPADFEGPRLDYDTTWAILYTSGTTGRPKGAMVTYRNFFYNAVGMGQAIQCSAVDVNLVMLPTFHAGGLGLYAGPTFYFGGTVVIMRDFDPGEMLRAIENWRVTTIILVPPMYLMLHDHPAYGQYDLSSVRLWSSGGSPLPPSLVELYAQDDIIIQQGFGMTETGPTVFLIPKGDAVRKAGSVGKPVLHTDVCIMDQDHKVLGPDEVGELCI